MPELRFFAMRVLLDSRVNGRGEIPLHGILADDVTLEFEGSLDESTGEGRCWTFYPDEESLSGCEGTWAINLNADE